MSHGFAALPYPYYSLVILGGFLGSVMLCCPCGPAYAPVALPCLCHVACYPRNFSRPLIPVTCAGMLYKPCHVRPVYFWYTLGATILMLYQGCSTQTLFQILVHVHVSGSSWFVCAWGGGWMGCLPLGVSGTSWVLLPGCARGSFFAPFFLTRVGWLPALQWWVCVLYM